jgi:microsomal dipeptidase-like Zn-dependent dipeptidase
MCQPGLVQLPAPNSGQCGNQAPGIQSSGVCKPIAPCGGNGQRACCVGEGAACQAGLVQLPAPNSGQCGNQAPGIQSGGVCKPITPCGGEDQRACCVGEGATCQAGLAQVRTPNSGQCGNLAPGVQSDGVCRRVTACGGRGERACTVLEPKPGCNPGLVEIAGCTGECFGSSGTCADLRLRLVEPTANATPLPATDPMRGFADIHVHMFAHLAFGGGVLAGAPFDKTRGIAGALGPDYATNLDLVSFIGTPLPRVICPSTVPGCGRVVLHGDHTVIDDTAGLGTSDGTRSYFGAPVFNGWPTWHTTTHQQVYYKWLERAWRGGMRLMTMLAVNNEVLCRTSKRLRNTDCANSMPGVDAQLAAARDFERWLDSQPGGGWFKIVLDPDQAEAVIRSGKLAVVLGIEADSLFQCKTTSTCTADSVARDVDKYFALGVRHIFPTHDFDTAFSGTAVWMDMLNVGNRVIDGQWYDVAPCKTSDFALSPVPPALARIVRVDGPSVPYPNYPAQPGCNTKGLTELGRSLIGKLMARGMLIDVDHMSERSIDGTIELARARGGYPLMVGHGLFAELYEPSHKRHERMRSAAQLEALRRLGGLVSVMTTDELEDATDCKHSSRTFARSYQYAVAHMKGPVAVGSDFNGLAPHVGPRYGDDACGGDAAQAAAEKRTQRLAYPFTLPGLGRFDRQVTGQRTFDFNTDGLAHVGLMPDLLAELLASGVDVEPLLHSAAAYVQSWRRAVQLSARP